MNENKERGIKNIKNAFKWGGLWSELAWIAFWIFLLITVYGYRTDIDSCNAQLDTLCVWNCRVEDYRFQLQEGFPGATMLCNYTTKQCMVAGAPVPDGWKTIDPEALRKIINKSGG